MANVQILIAAYGPESLDRIASLNHPEYPGVKYTVSWQNYGSGVVPPALDSRRDFFIHLDDSKGLCNNRNTLLRLADSDIAVISDDDIEYSVPQIAAIVSAFEDYPDCDFLTFRYASGDFPKSYPSTGFDLRRPPKGYFVTSMELAFNMMRIRQRENWSSILRFNPAFGVNGSHFICGEEDILLESLLRNGFKGMYVPVEICTNTGSTTSDRLFATREFIETKGAVLSYVKPHTWPLRLLAHALRARKSIPPVTYCKWGFSGVTKAKRNSLFTNY